MAFGASQVQMYPSDDDDMYSGFNEYPSALSTKDIETDEIFQEALRSSFAKKPGILTKPNTAMRFGTSRLTSALGRTETAITSTARQSTVGAGILSETIMRPMTAVRGAGYTSQRQSTAMFDPLNQAQTMTEPTIAQEESDRPEDKIKQMERRITELIDEACLAENKSDFKTALAKAKEASARERSLIRMQEQAGLSDSHNLDLTFLVLFNLACQYASNKMYTEALNTYQVITRNRMFTNANRLKVNMGNIYVHLGQYQKAIKMYRMALDQVPNTHKDLRVRIMHNIGILFVKLGQFDDACTSFEYIMQEKPDFKAGLHVILCYYAVENKERMKEAFQMLLAVPLLIDDDDKYAVNNEDVNASLLAEVVRNDSLTVLERQMKQEAEKCILTAAKLISPVIGDSYSAGYNWCLDAIKSSLYAPLAGDLEINKAISFLCQGEIPQAIDSLKLFDKRESKVASAALTNLSFIYLLQGNVEEAEKSSEAAYEADCYNANAYVNLGNCALTRNDMNRARQLYATALENDSTCIQALFNLGLIHKQNGDYSEAVDCFMKLSAIMSNHPPVLYQLGHLHQLLRDPDQAVEWYLQLLSIVPTDPTVLLRLGEIFEAENDKQQAYHYYFESYRHYPSNLRVLDWLGSYYLELRVPEKAVGYYERAALLQPLEPRWKLMIGSCHRHSGNYQLALQTYKDVHLQFPENVDCLKFLIRLCNGLGLKDGAHYATLLKKVEKSKEVRERISSGRSGSRRGSARSSQSGQSPQSALIDYQSPVPPSTAPRSKFSTSETFQNSFTPASRGNDTSYDDPLGPLPERPKTSAGSKFKYQNTAADEFADDDFAVDELLPE
ncbi:unnamed protein product [Bemisia tabaci]|uniref:No mechanoreceptor potential B n=1 Tax=Bemisia tabaci TaxID=7038 RepID=A0A9P0F246_BEMTA|nr:unnamed protein product [Bemisia tabaci]